jgi:hypothetical protein
MLSQAEEARKTFTLKQDEPSLGTHIPQVLVSSSIPLDQTYNQLSDAHKAMLRGLYEDMSEQDEPPFPANGLGKLLEAINKGATKHQARGDFALIVHVASDGLASSVEVLKTPNDEFGRFAASVVMLTKFKPALCGAQACAMDFSGAWHFANSLASFCAWQNFVNPPADWGLAVLHQ